MPQELWKGCHSAEKILKGIELYIIQKFWRHSSAAELRHNVFGLIPFSTQKNNRFIFKSAKVFIASMKDNHALSIIVFPNPP